MEEKPSETQPQVAPPRSTSRLELGKEKPWLKIVLISAAGLFLVGGLFFAGYKLGQRQVQPVPQPASTPVIVATPTPDPTAGWKTYTNTKYGYEIKYPPEIKMYEGGTETVFQFLGPRAQVPGEFTDGFGITIRVIENKENKTPRQLAEDSLKESQENIAIVGGDITKCRVEEAKRGDLEGARFIHCLRMPGSGILEFCEWFIHKGNTIETHANLQNESYRDLFNLMLSAFKFLPSTSPGQGE